MINNTPSDFRVLANEKILSIAGAADWLGISTATVRNWIKCGVLPSQNRNNKYFFYRSDIEKIKIKMAQGELEKLSKRANKIGARRVFIPEELIKNPSHFVELARIIGFIKKNNIKTTVALFLLSLNLLKKEGILLNARLQDIIKSKLFLTNKQIQKEIKSWFLEIKVKDIQPHFSFLLNCELPTQRDILGILYQSLLFEGAKSQSGSYYTPSNRVNDIVADYVQKHSKVLDPCCGTGQFLLAFADIVENPLNIYGMDCDKTAIRIARINILIKFKNKDFVPNIFCKNTLFDVGSNDLFSSHFDKNIKGFDVIATNPPWGVRFSKAEIKQLKSLYPQITSLESFSYFLKQSLGWLSSSGVLSFLLPESILNVRAHKDIREFILKKAQIKKVIYLHRIFKNVFTPVIRLDLEKYKQKTKQTIIQNIDKKYKAQQIKWVSNHDFIFDIHSNNMDFKIIDKIYKVRHITLEKNARWVLGIVTGNNKKFIISKNRSGFEPIYRGKDIKKFVLSKPSCYIRFQPKKFQQTAPEYKYRSKEKLIYKFISNKLVFAYDNQKRLTLNSANILIPKIPDYPIKVILALFNSSLYQFLFQKKFSSIKVLRSHIEVLPLPLWDKRAFSKIVRWVDIVMQNPNQFHDLDSYIAHKFALTKKEINYIHQAKK